MYVRNSEKVLLGKLTIFSPILDLVNINMYIKSDENPLICSQDMKQNQNPDANQRP